jgi:hypothetical protein
MVKKQRFRRAIEKNFDVISVDAAFVPSPSCPRVFPGIKLALPVATVSEAEKNARDAPPAAIARQTRKACADSLGRRCA